MSSIFPTLVRDVEQRIIFFCDTDSLIRLSGLHKDSHAVLSNDNFFKDRFFIQHPHLGPFDGIFTILRSDHPSNCWKVMCRTMNPQYRHQLPEQFKSSFSTGVVPRIKSELQKKNKI